MEYNKVYCWTNVKGEDGYLVNIDDNEFDIHGTSYLYTINEYKCKELTEKYNGSKYYLVTDIEEINDYDSGLDEDEGSHYITVNGINYKFMGTHRDKDGEWNWGWVSIEEYVKYDHKCKECEAMLHVDCEQFTHHEGVVCEECFEGEGYLITDCCGAVFSQKDHDEKYINFENGEDAFEKFEIISVCRDCLDKNDIVIDFKRFCRDNEYDKQIFKMVSAL